ncbi:hypothetical protein BVY01_02090 [bacterium I07]|nr:hypothetical protein BVY01_02090 [bacterium I07]
MKTNLIQINIWIFAFISLLFSQNQVPEGSTITEIDTVWVRHYASGNLLNMWEAAAATLDNAGNIIVTGPSLTSDVVTIKYDPTGTQLWTSRFVGNMDWSSPDTIFSDASGNIYILQYKLLPYKNGPQGIIKYNSMGVEQWIMRFDDLLAGYSWKNATVDGSGNLYLTGNISWYEPKNYVTVKFDASAIQQWISYYDGPGKDYDNPSAIAVDDSGNVYVTGTSVGSETNYDFATIKYNASGVEQWIARYSAPEWTTGVDYAEDITVDKYRNVYVTGWSVGRDVTVKYNASGVEQWILRYNEGDDVKHLVIDQTGNVFISFFQASSSSWMIAKFDSSGVKEWEIPAILNHINTFQTDDLGNVYLAGEEEGEFALRKVSSSGDEQWTVNIIGPGGGGGRANEVFLDEEDNVYATGFISLDLTNRTYMVKYNSSGQVLWGASYSEPNYSLDTANTMTVDQSGNVFVAGSSHDVDQVDDYVIVKYDGSGVEKRILRFDGGNTGIDRMTDFTSDDLGNVYVTGISSGERRGNFATTKYNTDGAVEWTANYRRSDDSDNDPAAIIADDTGNVYVTGRSRDFNLSNNRPDYVTVKYNSSGFEEWAVRSNIISGRNIRNAPVALAVDHFDNVYVIGSSVGLGTNEDYTTIKINAAGEEQWLVRYNGPGNGNDRVVGLVVDKSGNVYVTGMSWSVESNYDYTTLKYNVSGLEQWASRYDGPASSTDRVSGLIMDDSGNVYVTGKSWAEGTKEDYATIKYDSSGNELWVARYNGTDNGADTGIDIGIDETGNVYVTGSSWSDDTGFDYVTVKYNASGNELWVTRYDGPLPKSEDVPSSLVIDGEGYIYVAGSSAGRGESMFTTIKYTQSGTLVQEYSTPGDIPIEFTLHQNYPNPFNPKTRIQYSIPVTSEVKLEIYNVLGEKVATLKDDISQVGLHSANWTGLDDSGQEVSAGVYIARLQAGSFNQSIRMLLLK